MFHRVVNALEKGFLFSDQEKKKTKDTNMKVNGSKIYLMVREQSILQMEIFFQVDLSKV